MIEEEMKKRTLKPEKEKKKEKVETEQNVKKGKCSTFLLFGWGVVRKFSVLCFLK